MSKQIAVSDNTHESLKNFIEILEKKEYKGVKVTYNLAIRELIKSWYDNRVI